MTRGLNEKRFWTYIISHLVLDFYLLVNLISQTAVSMKIVPFIVIKLWIFLKELLGLYYCCLVITQATNIILDHSVWSAFFTIIFQKSFSLGYLYWRHGLLKSCWSLLVINTWLAILLRKTIFMYIIVDLSWLTVYLLNIYPMFHGSIFM